MDQIMEALKWVGYAFAVIGLAGTLVKSLQVWLSLQSLSWKEFDRLSKRVIKNIRKSSYYPEIIVTIGRGGAILGSVISGNLTRPKKTEPRTQNIPILGCDRMYHWVDGQRQENPDRMIDFAHLRDKDVLLVAGDILTGGTMEAFAHDIKQAGAKSVKTACLVKGSTAAFSPDYYGREIPGDFRMPWMYKGYGYVRDSRKPGKTNA